MGKYPVGSLLPSETELTKEFGVGRHTVREAIRFLQVRGMVSPQQGRGTRVDSDRQSPRLSHFMGSLDEIERYGRETRLSGVKSSTVIADAALATRLPCEPGTSLLHIASYREGRNPTKIPVAWNETYILGKFASIENEIEAWNGAIYSLVEHRFGVRVHSIRQEAKALNLDAVLAVRLGVEPGVAGLQLKRIYMDNEGSPLLYGFNTYVGEDFTLVMDIRNHGPS
jgi:GntR family transcriptional regulator